MPNEEESINHALFTCPYAHRIWRLLNALLLANHSFTNDSEESITFLVDNFSNKNLSEEERLIPFWIIWRIWKARNNFVFNKYWESPSRMVLQVQAEVHEWITTLRSALIPAKDTQPVMISHPIWINLPCRRSNVILMQDLICVRVKLHAGGLSEMIKGYQKLGVHHNYLM